MHYPACAKAHICRSSIFEVGLKTELRSGVRSIFCAGFMSALWASAEKVFANQGFRTPQ
jgi:hypothetical protein